MSNLHNDRYDEIKSLLRKSKFLFEQDTQINVAKDIQSRIRQEDEYETAEKKGDPLEKDKVQKYRISGGILALHGKSKSSLEITSDDKMAFQQTMDEFVTEVSNLVDFNILNVYPNNVEWSGKLIDDDIEFIFTIGEDSGIYINGKMVKVDEDFLSIIDKIQKYYQKFKLKWSKVLGDRKKTPESPQ